MLTLKQKKQKEGDNMPLKTDDLFMQVNDTKSVTLNSGVAYTKGMLVKYLQYVLKFVQKQM